MSFFPAKPPGLAPPRSGGLYRILVYTRVSKEEGTTGSFTFETQTLRITQKLDSTFGKDNYESDELRDDGLSGSYGFRPTGRDKKTRKSLQTIKERLLGGTFDAIIVYDLSRFCRNPLVFFEMLDDVVFPSGVLFLSATEDYDFNSIQGRSMGGMMSIINGMYRDGQAKRCGDATATSGEKGFCVGRPGYGWTWGDKSDPGAHVRRGIVPVEQKVRYVRQMVDQYLAGWSIIRITKELNDAGVPSPSGKAKWTNSVVFNVMDNPLHAGFTLWKGELIEGKHAEHRLYDKDVFDQIKAARKRRSIMRTRTAATQVNLLLGFAVCARCGKRLYMSGAHCKWSAYRCNNGMAQGQRTCPGLVASCPQVEGAVVDAILQVAQSLDMQTLILEKAAKLVAQEDTGLRGQKANLREQLAKFDRDFDVWAGMSLSGMMTPEQFGGRNKKMLADKAAVEAKLAEVEAALASQTHRTDTIVKVQKALRDFPNVWKHLDLDERRQVLSQLVDDLRIDRKGTMIHVFLKIALLPAQEICLKAPSRHGTRPKATGIAALTQRQMGLLYHISEGRSLQEAAVEMGVSYATVKTYSWQVQRELGISHLRDAAALARPRINALLGTLPIGKSVDPRSQERVELRLSPKLMAVLPYIVAGATSDEITAQTGLSKSTINGRRAAIYEALGVHTLYELGLKAKAAGLV